MLLKFIPLSFFIVFFLQKIWENVESLEKMYCNKSRKSLYQQLLFEVSLFRFHFASVLEYLGCFYKENTVK